MLKRETKISLVSFLFTGGTLLCCTIPALIAIIAGGAAVSALISAFPLLITISQYKNWIFLAAGLLIALSFYFLYRRGRQCAIEGAEFCVPVSKAAKIITWLSFSIFLLAVFISYIAAYFI